MQLNCCSSSLRVRKNKLFCHLKQLTEGFLHPCVVMQRPDPWQRVFLGFSSEPSAFPRDRSELLCTNTGCTESLLGWKGDAWLPPGKQCAIHRHCKGRSIPHSEKMPTKNMSKWFIWDMEDCLRSRTESGDNNGGERGFSIPNIEGKSQGAFKPNCHPE